jgi:RHS repeat-associated protein
MAPPSGTTLPAYSQSYGYDSLDRLTSGSAGTYTYGDASQVHAVTSVSSEANPYASYDAMGNMTCRNTDTTSAHTRSGGTPTGAAMTYDAHGQMASWTAPSGTVGSAHYLYDAEGNRVLSNSSNAGTTTDTVYFDGYTETVLSNGATTTSKYYNANGARVAVRVGGSTLDYLANDPLGSNSVALNNTGQVIAIQHYSPYGSGDYSWGTMPTSFNYAGERLDSQTGLLYDSFRYYDPVIGRFVRSDNVQDNSTGMDPYAYVGDNPETRNDPSGHCWPWCTALIGAAVGAVISVGITVAKSEIVDHKPPSLGEIAGAAASGAVSGAVIGVLGPGASLGAAIGIGALAGGLGGAAGGAAQQVTTNLLLGKGREMGYWEQQRGED